MREKFWTIFALLQFLCKYQFWLNTVSLRDGSDIKWAGYHILIWDIAGYWISSWISDRRPDIWQNIRLDTAYLDKYQTRYLAKHIKPDSWFLAKYPTSYRISGHISDRIPNICPNIWPNISNHIAVILQNIRPDAEYLSKYPAEEYSNITVCY